MAFKMRSGNKVSFKSMGSSPAKQKVDPDAPGTKGKPGYEPPVKRSDLDAKGKAIWDAHRKKKSGGEKMLKKFSDLTPAEIKVMKLDKPMGKKSPAKQYDYSKDVSKNIKSQGKKDRASNTAKKDASILAGDTDAIVTNQALKNQNKKNKQDQRSADSDGGRRRTIKERRSAKDTKLAEKGDQAAKQEARGEGKRGFSWRNAGMAALEGQGLIGAVRSGIGGGEYKSTTVKRKQEKRAGKAEIKAVKTNQKAARKKLRADKKAGISKRLSNASDLSTDI